MSKLIGVDGSASGDGEEVEEGWLLVDTGFARYLGRFVEVRQAKDTVTGERELVLDGVVRYEQFNLPTQRGIVMQVVPSSPIPWAMPFAGRSRLSLPLSKIVWTSEVDGADVAAQRKGQRTMQGPPRIV